jgi:hypothetical protein
MRLGLDLERPSMSVPSDNQTSWPQAAAHNDAHVSADQSSGFVSIAKANRRLVSNERTRAEQTDRTDE